MAAYKTSSPLLSFPPANGVSVTPSGVSEGWSVWVEMGTATEEMRVASIIALPGVRASGNFYEVEIGVGATLGVVQPVAADRGRSGSEAVGPADLNDALPLSVLADVIHVGDKVWARLLQTSTLTTAWTVSFQYYALPMAGTVVAATVGPVNVPSGSRMSVSSGAAFAYGTPVEITPATDADWTIGKVLFFGGDVNRSEELQIGTGPNGGETWLWTISTVNQSFPFGGGGAQGGPSTILQKPPLGAIPIGTRVAMRARSHQGVRAFAVGLVVTKQAVTGLASMLVRATNDYVTVTSAAGGLETFTAWTTYIASTATDIVLVGMSKNYPQGGLAGETRVQLGFCPDSSPANTGTLIAEQFIPTGLYGGGRFNFALPAGRLIPTGSRVVFRIATAHLAGGQDHALAFDFFTVPTVPDFDNWTNDLIQQVYLTDQETPFQVFTGANAWEYGSWVPIDANVPVDRVITAYAWENPPQVEAEVQLGISEVPLTTIRYASGCDSSDGGMAHDVLPGVPADLPTASALAIRARCSLAGVQTFLFAMHYTAAPASPAPEVVILDLDCESGIFTVTGTDFGTLTSVERDGTPVDFVVLTSTATEITFQLTELFVDGEYCVVVTNDTGPSDPFCEDFECEEPGCLALTDEPAPVPPVANCVPLVDGDWILEQVVTEPNSLNPNEDIVTANGETIVAFTPVP